MADTEDINTGPLMAGKRGLIMGVANDHSIAWGISRMLAAHGAELAFTYQDEGLLKRVKPLAEQAGSDRLMEVDVEDSASMDRLFDWLKDEWGSVDFIVHSLAFSDRKELAGRYMDTTLDNFLRSMHISCYSFTEVCRRAHPLMQENGGSLLTLTYMGAQRVMPSYNVMGVAKAALEASVRYLAADVGPDGIRVNAISAGPMRTLAGSAVGAARYVFRNTAETAPLRRNISLNEVGGAGLYLLSELSGGVTGEIHYVDSGYNAVGMRPPEPQPKDG